MITLREIAARIEGELSGDGECAITGVASIVEATEGSITFILNRSFERYLADTRASAVIVGRNVERNLFSGRNAIVVNNPALAHVQVAELFEEPQSQPAGISDRATVSSFATVSDRAVIYPYVYIGEGTVVEEGAIIYPFCFLGRNVKVGEGTVIRPNVSIYDGTVIGKRAIIHAGAVLGGDGFGYVWDGRQHRKIPQLGMLIVEDDVEIGANTCIDRASLDRTTISRGTKIDNLVQIGHNVAVGRNVIMAAQVGIAGSSTVGNGVVLGGKVGVNDHVTIGDGVMAAGGTGITKNVNPKSIISGTPHMTHRDWLRLQVYLRKLPELFGRLDALEKKLVPGADDD